MSSASRTKTAYIETNDAGKPCLTLSQLADEVANEARFHNILGYVGINSRAAGGRRKVKITITVEDAE